MIKPAILATLLAGTALQGAEPAPVHFDWFEYTGRDPVFAADLPKGHYRNPILSGFYPDPSITRVGDDYYLINSTFSYFPGIPIFHSRDLVNWKQIGHAITRPDQLPYDGLGVSRAIFAPAIEHHDGTFYIICTMVDAGGNFVITAKDPAGPWSDPTWLHFEGIDPSLFFDDDGRAWMVNNGAPEGTPLYEGHRAIWIQEFDPAARKMIGPRKLIINGGVDIGQKPVWIEGPHIYKRGDYYYLCCAEGGTSVNHSQVIFRTKELMGTWTPWENNPILSQRDLDNTAPNAVTSTGHADLVIGPDGNWWSIFLACRPYEGNHYNTGRETFLLPVTWTEDGWPVILPKGERVPYVAPAPSGVEVAGKVPLTGNFTWRDDFNGDPLNPFWIMLRTPKSTWWDLGSTPGQLSLMPSKETLQGTGNPAFLARRVQHTHWDASMAVSVPTRTDVVAGLVVFQGEKHHFFAGVKRQEKDVTIFLERASGNAPEVVSSVSIPSAELVRFRTSVDADKIRFEFAAGNGVWRELGTGDARILSTETAGGFVGSTVGPHARVE